MIKKISIFLILLLFTGNCGFTPIYSKKNINISIEKLNLTGDRTINNFLKLNLYKYKNKDTSKKIFLEVVTFYEKIALTKDSSGKVKKYELVAQFEITINPGNKKIRFTQNNIMENMNNKFDENNYERSTKRTFANNITEELIQKLIES
jgi:hypothetical protein